MLLSALPFPRRLLAAGTAAFVTVAGLTALAPADAAGTYTVTNLIGVGSDPRGVAVDPSTHTTYVVNHGSSSVSVIDATNSVVATVPVGTNSYDLAVDSSSHAVYVTDADSNTVTVIDSSNVVAATVPVGAFPYGVATDPSTHTIYVANRDSGTVSVIDGATNSVTATVPVGSSPYDLAVDQASGSLYVTNYNDNTVSVVDTATNTVSLTFTVGNNPFGVAVDPSTDTIYVSSASSNDVSVIDGPTKTITAVIPVGQAPFGIAVDPSRHVVYAASYFENTVSVIDGATNTVATTINGFAQPFGIAVDPATSLVYVANAAGGTVSVVEPPAPAPAVTAIAPTSGPMTGGTEVVITGTGFTGATAVNFGGNGASFTVDSDTQIRAISPPSTSTFSRHVWVVTPAGQSVVSSADRFGYTGSVPALTAITPSGGPVTGGTEVVITGSGFLGTTNVRFGTAGPAIAFSVDSDTQITADAPPSAAGVRNIRIRTGVGTSPVVPAGRFVYGAAPTVTTLSPSSGTREGGTEVIITGTDFTGATKVAFGLAGPATSFTVDSDTQITAVAPPSSAAVKRHVSVRTPAGTSAASSADLYRYL